MSKQKKMDAFEKKFERKDALDFNIGDTIDVHFQVTEGDKTRTQIYTGIVIAKKGRGASEMFTVRRISYGEGVERIFPYHSPLIEKIEIKKVGKVRRAKLYYLRGRKGKSATKVEEKVGKEE